VSDAAAYVRTVFDQAAATFRRVDDDYLRVVAAAAELLVEALSGGRRVFLFGNGGSAADAQHIAAELVGRFARERPALPAVALSTNSALLTAWSNDKGYEDVFARELSALAVRGDVAWAISTSGNSPSVVRALALARQLGVRTLGLTGATGGEMRGYCDVLIAAPATETPRIQELHTVTYHAICALVEQRLFATARDTAAHDQGTSRLET
jgi:D-sedoheptulose 7-phosphate isomerase